MGRKWTVAFLTVAIVVVTGYGGAVANNNLGNPTPDGDYDSPLEDQPGLSINNSDDNRYVVQVSLVPERIQKVNVSYENDTSETYVVSDEPVPLTGIVTRPDVTDVTPSAPSFVLTTEAAPESHRRYDLEYDVPNASVLVTVSLQTDGQQEFKTARVLRCDTPHPQLQRVAVNMSSQSVSIRSRCT